MNMPPVSNETVLRQMKAAVATADNNQAFIQEAAKGAIDSLLSIDTRDNAVGNPVAAAIDLINKIICANG